VERDAQRVVVAFRRTWSKRSDQPASGEHIYSGERLCQGYRPPQDGERDSRGQSYIARPLDYAREGCRPVEPGRGEDELVVGGDRREPAVPSGVHRLLEPPKRESLVPELHQRQVDSQIHESIVSDFARSGSELTSPLLRLATSKLGLGWTVVGEPYV